MGTRRNYNKYLGKVSQIPAAQISQLIQYAGGLLLLEILIILAYIIINNIVFKRRALYDPRVISQKISRMAYRTCLRLYVIGPKTSWSTQSVAQRKTEARTQSKMRKELMLRMVAAYRQFHMANGAFFVPKQISARSAARLLTVSPRGDAGWAKGLHRSRHMISVDALGYALAHATTSSLAGTCPGRTSSGTHLIDSPGSDTPVPGSACHWTLKACRLSPAICTDTWFLLSILSLAEKLAKAKVHLSNTLHRRPCS